MEELMGRTGSRGKGMGVLLLKGAGRPDPAPEAAQDPCAECGRLRDAADRCLAEFKEMEQNAFRQGGAGAAEIFQAYQAILEDPYFLEEMLERLRRERLRAEWVAFDACRSLARCMADSGDGYLAGRAADFRMVGGALLRVLAGENSVTEAPAGQDIVLAADDLSPADTISIDKSRLKGIVIQQGTTSSHTVILARTLGIPAVVGVGGLLERCTPGALVLVDGDAGRAVLSPDAETLTRFTGALRADAAHRARMEASARRPAATRDGRPVAVRANTGDCESLRALEMDACDGIGLFRTEFLFLGRSCAPTEEEQFAVYREAVTRAGGKEVIIRTLDVGGDKQASYMGLPAEANPFLGLRGIRVCLERPELFRTQLRAILRASLFGPLKIMFPMVTSCPELACGRRAVESAAAGLRAEGVAVPDRVAVGVMVETPASVLLCDRLAAEADFFSIGTNDLTQYIMAADRMNQHVAALYDAAHPAVLRAVAAVARAGRAAGVPVGICGEAAADEALAPLWAAMGVGELSMAAGRIGAVKAALRASDARALESSLPGLLACRDGREVRARLKTRLEEVTL